MSFQNWYNVEKLHYTSTKEVFPMYTLSQVPNKMQQILTTTADEAAHQHGVES